MTETDMLERLGDRLAEAETAIQTGDARGAAFAIGGAKHWYAELAGHDWQPLDVQVSA